VSITGATNSIAGTTTFSNTGVLTLGDGAGDSLTFADGVTATAPSVVNLAGTVAATSGASTITLGDNDTGVSVTANATVGGTATGLIDLGDVTLADGVTLTVGTGIGNAINLDAVSGTAGGAASNLTVNTTGAVAVAEAVGTDVGTVTITQSGGTTFADAVSAGTVTLTDTTGTVSFQGNLTVNGLATFPALTAGGLTTQGAATFEEPTRLAGAVLGNTGFANNVTIQQTLLAGGAFGAAGGLTVDGRARLNGPIQLSGLLTGLTEFENLAASGTLTVAGTTTFGEAVSLPGGISGALTVNNLVAGGNLTAGGTIRFHSQVNFLSEVNGLDNLTAYARAQGETRALTLPQLTVSGDWTIGGTLTLTQNFDQIVIQELLRVRQDLVDEAGGRPRTTDVQGDVAALNFSASRCRFCLNYADVYGRSARKYACVRFVSGQRSGMFSLAGNVNDDDVLSLAFRCDNGPSTNGSGWIQ
jgi:hypothetical protein